MSNALPARWLTLLLAVVLLAPVVLLPAAGAPKAKPASAAGKPPAARTAEVTTRDDTAAFRLLDKHRATIDHPGKATEAQLVQAAHDATFAAELMPDLELQPWFHADLGTVFYARAKAKRDPEHRYFLEKANVQFKLAALTHHIDIGSTGASHVKDYEAPGRATASFILYSVGLTEYELGRPEPAKFALDLLLAAAADHDLRRPEYVQKARALLPEVNRAYEKQKEGLFGHQPPSGRRPVPRIPH